MSIFPIAYSRILVKNIHPNTKHSKGHRFSKTFTRTHDLGMLSTLNRYCILHKKISRGMQLLLWFSCFNVSNQPISWQFSWLFIHNCNVAAKALAIVNSPKAGQRGEGGNAPKPSQNHPPQHTHTCTHKPHQVSTISLWARNESRGNP